MENIIENKSVLNSAKCIIPNRWQEDLFKIKLTDEEEELLSMEVMHNVIGILRLGDNMTIEPYSVTTERSSTYSYSYSNQISTIRYNTDLSEINIKDIPPQFNNLPDYYTHRIHPFRLMNSHMRLTHKLGMFYVPIAMYLIKHPDKGFSVSDMSPAELLDFLNCLSLVYKGNLIKDLSKIAKYLNYVAEHNITPLIEEIVFNPVLFGFKSGDTNFAKLTEEDILNELREYPYNEYLKYSLVDKTISVSEKGMALINWFKTNQHFLSLLLNYTAK